MTSALDLEYRTYFRTLDSAMADFELPLSAVDKVREITHGLRYEHVYVPESRQYIALEALGADKPLAYITALYVAVHPEDGESQFFELPAFAEAVAAADAAAESRTAAPAATVTEAAATPAPSEASAAKSAVASAIQTGALPVVTLAEPVAPEKPTPRVTNMGVGKRADIAELPCPTCFIDLPATGICDLCG